MQIIVSEGRSDSWNSCHRLFDKINQNKMLSRLIKDFSSSPTIWLISYAFEVKLWISTWNMAQVRRWVPRYHEPGLWTKLRSYYSMALFRCRSESKILLISELPLMFPRVLWYFHSAWRLRTKAQGQVQLRLNLSLPLCRVSSNIKKFPAEAIFYLLISGSHELVENVLNFLLNSQFDKLSRVRITLASYFFLESPAECKIWLSCGLNKAFNVPWDVTVHRNGIQCSTCWETEKKANQTGFFLLST